ncbi:MAG: type I methionyl aminopeptidase [Dehalococcoidia bacterium]|nr:type I methionyl aminopeptidase [Dehalococcoidia bacterium]
MGIIIKSDEEIALMREACRITARVLNVLTAAVKPGMTTAELDEIAEREAKLYGAKPSFKGYRGYPANLCVSVNDEIVHGIPGKRIIKEGDIVSIDFGVVYKGFQGDSARTVPAGVVSEKAKCLLETTAGALQAGIKAARPGARLGDVTAAIEEYAESRGCAVVREYTGHGIGRQMHEDPQVPNSTRSVLGLSRGVGPVLKKGMTLALEPMLNIGSWETKLDDNMWTVRTRDGSLSAHFEDTIAITEGEAEVLTSI